MSQKKYIIEVVPPLYQQVNERLCFQGYRCPECKGRGSFTDEVCRNEFVTVTCDYCAGTGRLEAEVVIRWKPETFSE